MSPVMVLVALPRIVSLVAPDNCPGYARKSRFHGQLCTVIENLYIVTGKQ
jgi:hypothetical protein